MQFLLWTLFFRDYDCRDLTGWERVLLAEVNEIG